MRLNQLRKEKGFTIIEVVLVLAIAGLIFLIVFLAVPQLQRSRRDTQRRSDVARIGGLLENFAANSGGTYPATGDIATTLDFSGNNLLDPQTGAAYTYVANPAAGSTPGAGNYTYLVDGRCNDGTNGEIVDNGTTAQRIYAVSIGLEGGGAACVDIQ